MRNQTAVQISHDPFGRFSIMRQAVDADRSTCAACGQVRRGNRLFIYGVNRDDRGRTEWDDHKFCSIGCYRSYHN